MFSLIDVRVDASTGPCIDGLSFEVEAPRALVSGAPYELFLASIGALPLQRGTLRVAGCAPREALARGLATAAAFSAPLPLSMTPLEYVVWSARLGGTPTRTRQCRAATRYAFRSSKWSTVAAHRGPKSNPTIASAPDGTVVAVVGVARCSAQPAGGGIAWTQLKESSGSAPSILRGQSANIAAG